MLKLLARIAASASSLMPRRTKTRAHARAIRKFAEPDAVVNPEHVPDYGVFVWTE